jgi:hypothetical protein
VVFFNRRPKATAPAAKQAEVPFWGAEDGTYGDSVVGESHYQTELASLARRLAPAFPNGARMKFTAVLVREVTNEFDDHAVFVAPVIEGRTGSKVGYLPRERAAALASKVERAGGVVACYGALIGGGNMDDGSAKSWGVVLDLSDD